MPNKSEEARKRILEEQQLANLMQQGLLLEALGMAIRLDQPYRSLNILKGLFLFSIVCLKIFHLNFSSFFFLDLMDQGESVMGDLEKMVTNLSTNQKDSLLRYSTMWNTNSRHCHQAQVTLQVQYNKLR